MMTAAPRISRAACAAIAVIRLACADEWISSQNTLQVR
jgi:hypothetical protein